MSRIVNQLFFSEKIVVFLGLVRKSTLKIYKMKKTVLTLFTAACLCSFMNAQVSIYSFASSSGTYTPITSGTNVANGITDDTIVAALPIGFTFKYNGVNYTQFGLNNNGWINLGSTAGTANAYNPISTGATDNIISALSHDLQLGYTSVGDRTTGSNIITNVSSTAGFYPGDVFVTSTGFAAGTTITAVGATTLTVSTNATTTGTATTFTVLGNIQYKLLGTSPNRTCVIQWTRARKYGSLATQGRNDLFNFQIRLQETTNVVSIVYGLFQTNATASTYEVGLRGISTSDFNNRKTPTTWAASAAGTHNTDTCYLAVANIPASGLTYTWTPAAACTGTPTAGTASGPVSACSGVSFNLVLTGYTSNVSGITFQWQSSATGVAGSFTNIAGATTSTYAATQTAAAYYQCVVTCSSSPATSNVVHVTLNTPSNCYCTPASSDCTLNDVITNVTIATINNTTTCSTNGYASYTTPTATLNTSLTYPIAVTVGSGGTEFVSVWIDYNQNGVFDTTEFTAIGSGNGVVINSNITIPGTALIGATRMRVRVQYNSALTKADACLAITDGETEDYLVTIAASAACTGTPTPGTASGPASVCSGTSFNLVLTGYTNGVSGITFQWQKSATGVAGSYTNIVGATAATYAATLTATTYYQCVVTCSGSPATSNALTVTLNAPSLCYCAPVNGSTSCIKNVTLNTLNHSSAGCENAPNYYTSVPALTATTTVFKGLIYPFSVTIDSSTAAIISVWIDYNQNGVFDSTEWNQVAVNALTGSTSTINLLIPNTALSGPTGMRIRSRNTGNTNGAPNACTTMGSGEAEDYVITIGTAAACSGTPTPGTASASVTSACSGVNFNLVLTGYTNGVSGITFQWQSSPSGTAGTFTNIAGATSPTYAASQTAATYYQCIVTCSSSPATSNVVNVTMNAIANCYCTSNATSASDEDILNVTMGTLNNTSTCTTTGGAGSILNEYSNYTAVAAPSLARTAIVPFSVQIGTCGGNYANAVKIFIDYNQNGSFSDAGENVYTSTASTTGAHIETGNITIPLTAALGNTRMRVVNKETSTLTSITECGTYGYGETEDYIVNIAAVPPACTGTPTAGNATVLSDSVCASTNFNLVLSGYTAGASGITFKWQSSPTGATYTDIAGATMPSYSATLTATTYYHCIVTCTSSGQTATSNVVIVYMNPVSNCYCTPVHSSPCSASNNIDSVRIVSTTLANYGTGCTSLNGQAYTIYPAAGTTTASLTAGTAYTFKVTTTANNIVSVWIDYNQNGIFDSTEWKQVCTSSVANAPNTVSITIPTTALAGRTGMRLRSRSSGSANGAVNACTSFASGETEDYFVTIVSNVGIYENTIGGISIFPNPTTGQFNITADNAAFTELAISVCDIQGKEVFRALDKNVSSSYQKQINLENLAKGLYYIKLDTGRGIKVQKLIIQ